MPLALFLNYVSFCHSEGREILKLDIYLKIHRVQAIHISELN